MCKYVKENICTILNEACPYIYWCDKTLVYKPLKEINSCKVAERFVVPKGFYKVEFERHGYLFIVVDDMTIKIQNPYNTVPLYVKLSKTKNGYKIKETDNGTT